MCSRCDRDVSVAHVCAVVRVRDVDVTCVLIDFTLLYYYVVHIFLNFY